jgi:hypothetical protein
MEVEKEEGDHGYPEVKLTGKRKDIEKVLADIWGPDSIDDHEDAYESVVIESEEINEAKMFYLIGDKEVSRDEVLTYKYDNKDKPVAKNGWPKWLYTNTNYMTNKPLEWDSIKKDMKGLEKKYGKGNVVVGGATNGGGPYIEIYSKSQK